MARSSSPTSSVMRDPGTSHFCDAQVAIQTSDLVVMTDAARDDSLFPGEDDDKYGATGGYATSSTVAITQGEFAGLKGVPAGPYGEDAQEGAPGMAICDIQAYLAEVSGTAGPGGEGYVGGVYCEYDFDAGPGGSGLKVYGSSTCLMANREPDLHVFRGGKGGFGGPFWIDCDPDGVPGGPGGFGAWATNDSILRYAGRATFIRGEGGEGEPPGGPGAKIAGNVVHDPALTDLPVLETHGSSVVGEEILLRLHAYAEQLAFLVVSDQVGLDEIPEIGGFPLFAVPASELPGSKPSSNTKQVHPIFRVLPIGPVGDRDSLDIHIPLAPINQLAGKTLFFQVLAAGPNGSLLSNVVAEVIAPVW